MKKSGPAPMESLKDESGVAIAIAPEIFERITHDW